MAKQRFVNTKFWSDGYMGELDPSEKLLFLYAITNQYTNITGIYEVRLKQVSLDTGLSVDMVEKIIGRFERDDKLYYKDGWIIVKNFLKHQNTNNPKIISGINRELKDIPSLVIAYAYSIGALSHSDLDLDLDLDSDLNTDDVCEESAPVASVKPKEEYTSDFEAVWVEYPRKIGKKKASKAYHSTRKKGIPSEHLLYCVKKYSSECIAQRRAETYIKHCGTFFGPDEPWRDYMPQGAIEDQPGFGDAPF